MKSIIELRERIQPNNLELAPGFIATRDMILEILNHLEELKREVARLDRILERVVTREEPNQ